MPDILKDNGIEYNVAGPVQQKTFCPRCSSQRSPKNRRDKPLSVNIKEKVWNCHNCGWTGPEYRSRANRTYTRPDRSKLKSPNEKVYKYLSDRCISEATAKHFSISLSVSKQGEDAIAFPFYKDGEFVNAKYRIFEDQKKRFFQESDAEKILYNYNEAKSALNLLICEGEVDALSFYQAAAECGLASDIAFTSIPDGGLNPGSNLQNSAKLDFIENSFDVIKDKKEIYLACDNDPVGQYTNDALASRLGKLRCKIVSYPEDCKDANDVLCKYGPEALIKCLLEAAPYPVEGVHLAKSFSKQLHSIYDHGYPEGIECGDDGLDSLVKLFPGLPVVISGIPGHGKALALDTVIPTTDGFKTMDTIEVGDIVFGMDGSQRPVIAKTEVMHNRPCYEVVFDDGSTVVCDEEHLWYTECDAARRSSRGQAKRSSTRTGLNDQRHKMTLPSVKSTKEIASSLMIGGKRNHVIPVCSPIQLEDKELPIPPYLLGVWLGDGTSSGGSITTSDEEIISHIRSLGYDVTKRAAKYAYGVLGLAAQLRSLGLIHNKHIPHDYMSASFEQRLELLRGLMDTDGDVGKRDRRCCFSNKNKLLIDSVVSLVCSLGIKATIIDGEAKIGDVKYGTYYRVCFTTNIEACKLFRKSSRQRVSQKLRTPNRYIVDCRLVDSVPVACIQVGAEDGMYLCTERFIPTHNSSVLDWWLLRLAVHEGKRFAVFSPENWPMETHLHRYVEMMVGKTMLGKIDQRMTKSQLDGALGFLQDHIYLVRPKDENFTLDQVLDTFSESIERYGVNGCVIDPWNTLEHQTGQMNEHQYIGWALSKITSFAQSYNQYFFIVAHPRKIDENPNGTYRVPTMYSISGSSNWFNKAGYGMIVYRNNEQEPPTTTIYVQKVKNQKFMGRTGYSDYIYDKESQRFYPKGGYPDRTNWIRIAAHNQYVTSKSLLTPSTDG